SQPPPPPPAVVSAAPPPTAAPEPAPPPKLDAIPRLDFNRIAAELALPIFWITDKNGSGAVDPDEVATLWGLSPSPPVWVEGGRFTPAFLAAYQAMAKIK